MLRKTRIALALIFFVGITLLLCGVGAQWWGWMAKLQFLPSCLALNFASVAVVLVLTFVSGRLYCSVICPLGVYQDFVVWLRRIVAGRVDKSRARRLRRMKDMGVKPTAADIKPSLRKKFGFRPERKIVRIVFFCAAVALVASSQQFLLALIAPYSAYGRMVHAFAAGVFGAGGATTGLFVTAGVTFVVITFLAWVRGRSYCNTICPVSTLLSMVSRVSLFRPVIDKSKCIACGRCYSRCKASCIDGDHHSIDYSRCLVCFDCLDNCSEGAIKYRFVGLKGPWIGGAGGGDGEKAAAEKHGSVVTGPEKPVSAGAGSEKPAAASGTTRRAFLGVAAMAGTTLALHGQNKRLDGGLAEVVDKQVPERRERLVPFGAGSVENFYSRCTACQLCVGNCPNGVLRPSTELKYFLQPVMGYENGYCRPECTACGDVCPAGAILPVAREEKYNVSIGVARIDFDLCLASNGEASCGNCARHCPSGAIRMVVRESDGRRIPVVNEERCTGCGACEFLCPARPLSAIVVDGRSKHIDKTDA